MIRYALSVYFRTLVGFDSLSFSTCTENVERIRVEKFHLRCVLGMQLLAEREHNSAVPIDWRK